MPDLDMFRTTIVDGRRYNLAGFFLQTQEGFESEWLENQYSARKYKNFSPADIPTLTLCKNAYTKAAIAADKPRLEFWFPIAATIIFGSTYLGSVTAAAADLVARNIFPGADNLAFDLGIATSLTISIGLSALILRRKLRLRFEKKWELLAKEQIITTPFGIELPNLNARGCESLFYAATAILVMREIPKTIKKLNKNPPCTHAIARPQPLPR